MRIHLCSCIKSWSWIFIFSQIFLLQETHIFRKILLIMKIPILKKEQMSVIFNTSLKYPVRLIGHTLLNHQIPHVIVWLIFNCCYIPIFIRARTHFDQIRIVGLLFKSHLTLSFDISKNMDMTTLLLLFVNIKEIAFTRIITSPKWDNVIG